MRSPFPGMDPYLESRWSGVHVLLMGAITAALNRALPAGLEARPAESVQVTTLAGERLRGYRPDVSIVETPLAASSPATPSSIGMTATLEPVHIRYLETPVTQRHVEIVDTSDGHQLVTAIEVLSPWNKLAGDLNESYRRKLKDYERASVNWVEIDLLRSSRQRLSITWDDLPPERRGDYLAVLFRAHRRQIVAYPISLRQPLPTVAVPLRPDEPSVPLDLQAVVERVYAEGPTRSIDYAKPADPPLSPDDVGWLSGLLAARA